KHPHPPLGELYLHFHIQTFSLQQLENLHKPSCSSKPSTPSLHGEHLGAPVVLFCLDSSKDVSQSCWSLAKSKYRIVSCPLMTFFCTVLALSLHLQ
uniref:Uncharacterized protein n=1 Tax=Amphilophus citrinellus TaxID=61819 RepID=A0A3Q0SE97_AMPCI